ncbi:hypothetical protein CEE37_02260 [candidate division LCP-89 bacterium B3_LCP]|uniref:Right handed beta helix domain-containing protein n=1 Tax=candidate division LCP-89 bacterium B3_LCP TaxID=2012998 RepID=A0A532V5X1_UNCL8|nr:MAG: hypothetical protein CEE37_02260 [candidate division LCP-89 bacterium B3_LCP]
MNKPLFDLWGLKYNMRYVLPLFTITLLAFFSVLLSGCGESTNAPPVQGYTLYGSLQLEDGADPSTATVVLYAVPQDQQLLQAFASNPTVGFSPYSNMLFNPANQAPLASNSPSVTGDFSFENLGQGYYILSANLNGYACAEPVWLNLQGDTGIGTLSLSLLHEVNGNISNNTTWQTGKAYLVTGDIMVLPTAVLTIQSGVSILLDGDYSFTVTGGFDITATPLEPTRIWLSDDHYNSGGDWGGIHLSNPAFDCEISGTLIRSASTAVKVTGGTTQIVECLFDSARITGVNFQGNAQGSVEYCIFSEGNTGLAVSESDPELHHNLIVGLSAKGIEVKNYTQAHIHHNVLIDCQQSIWAGWDAAPILEYNLFQGGNKAIQAESGFFATIEYNEFAGQLVEGIYLKNNCYPIISNNNFIDMPQTILHVNGNSGQQADTLEAEYNYWDGEDNTGIPDRIIDGHDIGSAGNPVGPVEYEPFRLQTVSGAGP